jgi:hypothetical protein
VVALSLSLTPEVGVVVASVPGPAPVVGTVPDVGASVLASWVAVAVAGAVGGGGLGIAAMERGDAEQGRTRTRRIGSGYPKRDLCEPPAIDFHALARSGLREPAWGCGDAEMPGCGAAGRSRARAKMRR